MHVNVTKSNGSALLKCQLYPVEGRTIRKVMGGGGVGNFRAAGIFFRFQIPCRNFFRP